MASVADAVSVPICSLFCAIPTQNVRYPGHTLPCTNMLDVRSAFHAASHGNADHGWCLVLHAGTMLSCPASLPTSS
jgi:hypothetical protein